MMLSSRNDVIAFMGEKSLTRIRLHLAIYFLPPRGKSGYKRCKMSSPAPPPSRQPKLLDRVRATMRTNRYSPRTEQTYVDWIKRFIRFHGVRHPQEMGAEEVKAFLSHLATAMNVAAST